MVCAKGRGGAETGGRDFIACCAGEWRVSVDERSSGPSKMGQVRVLGADGLFVAVVMSNQSHTGTREAIKFPIVTILPG
jgi:hypothetical protein